VLRLHASLGAALSCGMPPVLFEAVLFDMDGVLVNTMPMHRKVWRQFAAERGRIVDEAWLRSYDGWRASEVIQAILGPGLDEATVKRLSSEREHLFGTLLGAAEIEAIPDASAAVLALKARGIPCVLATSGVADNVSHVLRALGLVDVFDAVLTAVDVVRGKPAPDIYLLAAERVGVSPHACLAVEDAVPGIASALAAGCMVVGVSSSLSEAALRDAGARWVVPDLGPLPDIVFKGFTQALQ